MSKLLTTRKFFRDHALFFAAVLIPLLLGWLMLLLKVQGDMLILFVPGFMVGTLATKKHYLEMLVGFLVVTVVLIIYSSLFIDAEDFIFLIWLIIVLLILPALVISGTVSYLLVTNGVCGRSLRIILVTLSFFICAAWLIWVSYFNNQHKFCFYDGVTRAALPGLTIDITNTGGDFAGKPDFLGMTNANGCLVTATDQPFKDIYQQVVTTSGNYGYNINTGGYKINRQETRDAIKKSNETDFYLDKIYP